MRIDQEANKGRDLYVLKMYYDNDDNVVNDNQDIEHIAFDTDADDDVETNDVDEFLYTSLQYQHRSSYKRSQCRIMVFLLVFFIVTLLALAITGSLMRHHTLDNPLPYFHAVFLNINDGYGNDSHRTLVGNWLQQVKPDIIGLIDLNGWEMTPSIMQSRASSWGFLYSYLMPSSNIGVMSRWPIVIKAEYALPYFERGVLHISIEGIEFIIIEMTPSYSRMREAEALRLVDIVQEVTNEEKPAVILGDLNSLSSADRDAIYVPQQFIDTLKSMKNSTALINQFLIDDGRGDHVINYAPIDTLLNAGLIDLCFLSMEPKEADHYLAKTTPIIWNSTNDTRGRPKACGYTLPTESHEDEFNFRVRTDYGFGNSIAVEYMASCYVNHSVSTLSTHFPLHCHLLRPI